MPQFFIVPTEAIDPGQGTVYYGPLYFEWGSPAGGGTGTIPRIAHEHYAFVNGMLVLAEVNATDLAFLEAQSDVAIFPEDLNTPVPTQGSIKDILEDHKLPTKWLNPSTTHLELLRSIGGIMQFAQLYRQFARDENGIHDLFENATLDTRLKNLTAQEQAWFQQTYEALAASFGIQDPPSLNTNSQLRQLAKQAADLWQDTPFKIAGYEF